MKLNKLKVGIVFFIIIIILLNLNNFDDMPYVATVGKEKIYEKEFLIYLYEEIDRFEKAGGSDIWNYTFDGSNAFDVAKNNALETLYVIKLSNILAKEEAITLTKLDDPSVLLIADQFLSQIPNEILSKNSFESDNITTIAKENLLYLKTFNHITKSFTYTEEEFNIYLDEQYNNINFDSTKRKELENIYVDNLKKDMFDNQLIILKEQYPLNIKKDVWENICKVKGSVAYDGHSY